MIPRDYITEWRAHAPWVSTAQVEQDLVISRALTDIFTDPLLRKALAFRGGTALNKLYLQPPARYSEDIDLVQIEAGAAGGIMTALRKTLDPWLGTPRHKQSANGVTFTYRFTSEDPAQTQLRLKVEINTREHFSVNGMIELPYSVNSRWHTSTATITTYCLDELLGTKLRALYQRRKGRDLFDLHIAPLRAEVNCTRVVESFLRYMEHGNHSVSRELFEANLADKLKNPLFTSDLQPLLAADVNWNISDGANSVMSNLIALLPEKASN